MKTQIMELARNRRAGGMFSALVGMVMLVAAASPSFAGRGNAGNSNIMPPQSHPYGLTYSEWAEVYRQWIQAGGTADSAQSGPVWFLASAPFSPVPGAATAIDIAIPPGTALFGPALSFFNNNEGVIPPLSEEELLDEANAIWDALAVTTACIIDGVPVHGLESPQESVYRLETSLFPVTFPDGSTTDEVVVGAFLMIKPLPVGQHTVRLVGSIEPAPGFVLTKDVTFTVTVTP